MEKKTITDVTDQAREGITSILREILTTDEVPEKPHPPQNTPQWCRCGVCRPVPDGHEDLCCKRGAHLDIKYDVFNYMPLLGILEVFVKAAAIFGLKRSAFDHSVWRFLEKPHIYVASLPFADIVN